MSQRSPAPPPPGSGDGTDRPDDTAGETLPEFGLESTYRLLDRVKGGDAAAIELLCQRFLPRLRRWAAGRLPQHARDLLDTDDLVQEVLLRTIRHVGHFEPRRARALQAYVRKALDNRIREELRRVRRHGETRPLGQPPPTDAPSPLEELVGKDLLERYEAGLARLCARDRDAIIARVELGAPYAEVADALDLPSAEAARKAVSRALVRLAAVMAGP